MNSPKLWLGYSLVAGELSYQHITVTQFWWLGPDGWFIQRRSHSTCPYYYICMLVWQLDSSLSRWISILYGVRCCSARLRCKACGLSWDCTCLTEEVWGPTRGLCLTYKLQLSFNNAVTHILHFSSYSLTAEWFRIFSGYLPFTLNPEALFGQVVCIPLLIVLHLFQICSCMDLTQIQRCSKTMFTSWYFGCVAGFVYATVIIVCIPEEGSNDMLFGDCHIRASCRNCYKGSLTLLVSCTCIDRSAATASLP